ncbi:MAG: hypothetical protein K9L75_04040, partial [Spirochaetia bacterium]|nr:hypothetical protein [Spirochaetia bacterium]
MTPLRNTIPKSSKPSLFPYKLILPLLLFSALFGLLLISCSNPLMEDGFSTDAYTNLDYLWEDLDKRYAYFKEKGIDWETQKTKYHDELDKKAEDGTITHMELFNILAEMLKELRDGHVNLYGPVHTSYYNVRKYLVSGYDRQRMLYRYLDINSPHLLNDIFITTGSSTVKHGIKAQYPYHGAQTPYQVFSIWKDTPEPEGEETHTVLYITYSSFMDSLQSIDSVLRYIHEHEDLDGYIIDLRGNGGGKLQNVHSLMGRIVREPVTAYYEMRKSL